MAAAREQTGGDAAAAIAGETGQSAMLDAEQDPSAANPGGSTPYLNAGCFSLLQRGCCRDLAIFGHLFRGASEGHCGHTFHQMAIS